MAKRKKKENLGNGAGLRVADSTDRLIAESKEAISSHPRPDGSAAGSAPEHRDGGELPKPLEGEPVGAANGDSGPPIAPNEDVKVDQLPEAKRPQRDLEKSGFDYTGIDEVVAERARLASARIKEGLKRSTKDLIELGTDFLAVKEAMPRKFRTWLKDEFGLSERTVRNCMAAARRFGTKTAIIADLTITPTAAYLLAAPSTPEEAVEAAINRAQGGERITPRIAREIVAETKKTMSKAPMQMPTDQLVDRLQKTLKSFRDKWNDKGLLEFVRVLREWADDPDHQQKANN